MASDPKTLPVIAIPGLSPDSLGNYLASLGLLRILAQHWPSVRGAWHDGIFQVVGGPANLDLLLRELSAIAARRGWTSYQRAWLDAQKKSTKAKTASHLALWQAAATESELELFLAHIVPAARVSFNELLGKGGSAGNRDFSDGWARATGALAGTGKGAPTADEKREHLQDLLLGNPVRWMLESAPLLPDAPKNKQKDGALNAASWFSEANKLYNSGQRPFREGGISPWSMTLACEGLVFFAGGASRRLGARSRVSGAFPFVTRGAAPEKSGEAGRDLAEVWAPLWHRPMTLPEVKALFVRGRAEVRGRGVTTPSAFATAILRRGVDAGITEFRRFSLGRTTSAKTYEPRFEGSVLVRSRDHDTTSDVDASTAAAATAFDHLLTLMDRLPRDRKVGQRWRFLGLRGPLEAAMLDAAAEPADPEAIRVLLDAAVSVLDRIDRNRAFREREIGWQPLPLTWLPTLFRDEAPCPEARLALALVSGFTADCPFALYRFGVEMKRGSRFLHPKLPPSRWCWRPGSVAGALCAVMQRRILDWEKAHKDETQAVVVPRHPSSTPVSSAYVDHWLAGLVDDGLLSRWLSRFALFDWAWTPHSVRSIVTTASGTFGSSGDLCLFGLFQPLFDLRPVRQRGMEPPADLLPLESKARTPAAARTLASLMRVRQIDVAVRFASGRYAMAGSTLMRSSVPWSASDPERLLASLLFPVFPHERAALVERWLRPRRQGEQANA